MTSSVQVPFVEREDCRLCGKLRLKHAFSLPPTPPANAFQPTSATRLTYVPLEVMLCGNCGHAQLLHVVRGEYLFSNYAYASGTSASFRRHFQEYAKDSYERWALQPKDLVVEIGSNDGTLLAEFQNLGCRVVGVEPALNLADIAMKANVQTVNTFFDHNIAGNIHEGHGPAKLIVANNVLAHVNDLSAVFQAARRLLDDNGVFIFEVQYAGDLLSKGLFDMVYHEHLDYHALAPLRSFVSNVSKGEWFIQRVDRVPTHGGSLRIAVGRTSANRPDGSPLFSMADTGTVADLLRFEADEGVNTYAAWRLLKEKVTKAQRKLVNTLSKAYSNNPDATVVGFGAPAKATTLLHTFGLTRHDLEYIVDDSPLKQGLFTPGTNIPVRSPEVMLAEHPDYVVVLAWNFAPSIIEKWQPILPKTQFLVPFA